MSEIVLKRAPKTTILVRVEGTAPLIVHAWSEKAKKIMLAAQQGIKTPKEPKDPIADFEASKYKFADGRGEGFPTLGFKAAMVSGAGRSFGKSVKMTELRQNVLYLADGMGTQGEQLTLVNAGSTTMREDMVRVGMGTADLRYRAMYTDWYADLTITFNPNILNIESVLALVDAGGSNGIGEWRPEKSGSFGTYTVLDEIREIAA